jgi:uroporphyrinogen decarboxylase
MFREFIQPHYVPICALLRSHGVGTIFVDSDGYIDELIPLWMEVGINGFSPMEVAAGSDVSALKDAHGDDIVFAGHVDKRALARDRDSAGREADRVAALVRRGGYFPAVDHSVPPDVSLDNFRHFLDRLRSACR